MKKIFIAILLAAAAVFYGCSPLDRVNPVDPQAANYVGMHYITSAGTFTKLEDFTVAGDKIWSVDSSTNRIYRYSINGDSAADLDFNFTYSNIVAPTGICFDGTYLFMADKDTVFRNIKKIDPVDFTNTALPQLLNAPSSNVFIKCAATSGYVYAATATDVYSIPNAINSTPSLLFGGFINITDLKYNAATDELVVADSGNNVISIYSPAGAYKRELDFTYSIIGFGIKGDYIYVPFAEGIYQYYYSTGVTVKKFADFGEGAGRIKAAGPCGTYGDYVFVGTGTTIKCFGP